jgi:hypothetical protein
VDHLVVLGVVVSVQLLTEPRGEGGVDWVGIGAAWGLALAAKYQAALARLVVPPDGLGWWLLLAVPLALAALLRRGEAEVRVRLVGGALALASAAWFLSSQMTRYALPVAALMAALAAAGVAGLGRWPARAAACAQRGSPTR